MTDDSSHLLEIFDHHWKTAFSAQFQEFTCSFIIGNAGFRALKGLWPPHPRFPGQSHSRPSLSRTLDLKEECLKRGQQLPGMIPMIQVSMCILQKTISEHC